MAGDGEGHSQHQEQLKQTRGMSLVSGKGKWRAWCCLGVSSLLWGACKQRLGEDMTFIHSFDNFGATAVLWP